MTKVTILDCTFRDGGYYNNWDFPKDLTAAYLNAMHDAGVDVVELGFRVPPEPQFLGAFSYLSDDYLATLAMPEGLTIGVMVNARDLLKFDGGATAAVASLFRRKAESRVALVRIAAQFADLEQCREIAAELKRLGYQVGLNIMQVSLRSSAELTAAAQAVQSWDSVDVLYFADSFGNMDASAVTTVTRALAAGWSGPIGVHAHNNKGQGVANTLAARDAGATWLDGTVLGMGRGAGNAQTEYLLIELNQRTGGRYSPESLFPLIIDKFEPLRKRYDWGPNLLYYLSGTYGIHPTYVQEMLSRDQYDTHELISAVEFLREKTATSFSQVNLDQAIRGTIPPAAGTWTATGWALGRDVLLIAAGPGTVAHLDALVNYVKRHQPVVICVNLSDHFPSEYVTAYAACNPTRFAIAAEKYSALSRPLIAPRAVAPDQVRAMASGDLLDYGVEFSPDTFVVRPSGCVLPSTLSAAYGLAVAEASGARRVLLAGFDGYAEVSDPRRKAMVEAFARYQERPEALPLLALTPTSYDVPKSSIYAPII